MRADFPLPLNEGSAPEDCIRCEMAFVHCLLDEVPPCASGGCARIERGPCLVADLQRGGDPVLESSSFRLKVQVQCQKHCSGSCTRLV